MLWLMYNYTYISTSVLKPKVQQQMLVTGFAFITSSVLIFFIKFSKFVLCYKMLILLFQLMNAVQDEQVLGRPKFWRTCMGSLQLYHTPRLPCYKGWFFSHQKLQSSYVQPTSYCTVPYIHWSLACYFVQRKYTTTPPTLYVLSISLSPIRKFPAWVWLS